MTSFSEQLNELNENIKALRMAIETMGAPKAKELPYGGKPHRFGDDDRKKGIEALQKKAKEARVILAAELRKKFPFGFSTPMLCEHLGCSVSGATTKMKDMVAEGLLVRLNRSSWKVA